MDELVASIKELGIIQPLAVLALYQDAAGEYRDKPDPALGKVGAEPMRYEVIYGHRRSIAAERAGLETVPVMMFEDAQQAKYAIMLHANVCREDVTPFEEGIQFLELATKYTWSMDQLTSFFRKSEDYINDRVDVVRKDEHVAAALRDRAINLGQAKEIIKEPDLTCRAGLLEQAAVHGATISSLRVMRHNNEDARRRAQGELPINTSPQFVPGKLMDPDVCIWCGRPIELGNRAQVPIHVYHQADLEAVVAKVGLRNLTSEGSS